ncbi:Rossmann-fold NAD(P)(+)-binding protein [Amycolatopsis mediterranei S699]|uniref:Rossmann-fold NAD(P)(+)-binding protein n=2 Tax=Amycolatopsis mediterranei TaxID=33910 RepID=A0A0H3CV83_AMYMU|nr:FkbM family methyltransferase [Amycolatopsis mediterranei]ADJ41940.1 Rossmann-fold NAD(P)(+)-binding protein [Amycolatopsis mediterranei U32]AEK38613.1 Rossmann-fold NAD(P)(+)-binding protein [Amycolatopsis mediterranei S699]AFO73651.1 Rossmann-fold NAD(P)(+)-binding protein [Amycolatopsis mediterranei S699]AGT80779.1 Rossmann-fold NAD(P)(+)-binding protein [Amycolatopsis mediterranei RB]KDO08772.1 DNA-binding protein [Amycolatopsis mediterranei]
MISYAQNGEDVVLARVFAGQSTGRYVDLGAGYPTLDSVTKHFYDLGWRGINVEPEPTLAAELDRDRPEDVNLRVAVGAKPGTTVLHAVDGQWGRSTIEGSLAAQYREDWAIRDIEVEVTTLAALLDEHPGELDFLKIDVEGAECAVIEGADWRRHRPRVLVIEATAPGSPTPTHHEWEPMLLDAGYRCGLFDGLNRFYAQADDAEGLKLLSAPANVFDDFEPYALAKLRAQFTASEAARPGEVGYIRRLEETVAQVQQSRVELGEQLEEARRELERARRTTEETRRWAAALEHRVTELEARQRQ